MRENIEKNIENSKYLKIEICKTLNLVIYANI